MPSQSKAQQHLMAAAAHGATFPMAKSVRASMTKTQMSHFASTPTKNLPEHVANASHPARNLGVHLHPKGGIVRKGR